MSGHFTRPARDSAVPANKPNGNHPQNQSDSRQQNNVVQHHATYLQFNPAQAPFQPVATRMQRYETQRMLNVSLRHDQLLDLVASHNIQQMTETSRLDHVQRGLAQELYNMHCMFQNELQALEDRFLNPQPARVPELAQKQIEAPKSSESMSKAEVDYVYYHTSHDLSPSEEMLKYHTKEELTKSYLDEADKREASSIALRESAVVLRSNASKLCPEIVEHTSSSPLQIEGTHVSTDAAISPGYACCSTVFPAIGELIEHVKRAHTAPEDRLLAQARSEAVEIKTPLVNDHNCLEVTEEKLATKISPERFEQEMSTWTPLAVRNMSPIEITVPENMETFTFEFLRTLFSGENWSPGYYFIPEKSILPCKSYWILDVTHEPYLPQTPGAHGAKLTAFFNETPMVEGEAPEPENYLNVPVFVKTTGQNEYSYLGNYSQLRFSDKVGYDTLTEQIPESVLRFHAEQLAENGRPAWVTQALKEHFWPKPKYEGPIPTDSAINSPATSVQNGNSTTTGQERRVMRALVGYAAELKEWEKDSNLTVNLLTAESIFKAFRAADTDAEPGLRLYWEYLQCVGWDAGFYKMLVGFKESPVTKLEIGAPGKKRCPSPERKDGSTAAKMGRSSSATFTCTKSMKGRAREVMEEYPGPEAKTAFAKTRFDDPPVALVGGQRGESSSARSKKVESRPTSKSNGMLPSGPMGDTKIAKEAGAPVTQFVPPHLRART